ncbi:hypothetical protein HGM15179_006203, partial [Zosterops borbonicus]
PPGNSFSCDTVMGGGDISRRRSRETTPIRVSNVLPCLDYRQGWELGLMQTRPASAEPWQMSPVR